MDKELYDSVGKAASGIHNSVTKLESKAPKKATNSHLVGYTLVLSIILALNILEWSKNSRLETTDNRQITVEALRLADQQVQDAYRANRQTPASLSEDLQLVVDYQTLDAARYTLRMKVGPFNRVLTRDANEALLSSQLAPLIR